MEGKSNTEERSNISQVKKTLKNLLLIVSEE